MRKGASEVAHAWAHNHGNNKRAGNVFFEGDTIYSYGYHFPIARHYEGKILFTLRWYSVSTSSHIAAVRSAVSHRDIVYCWDVPKSATDISAHEDNIRRWKSEIESCLKSLTNAREKEKWMAEIDSNRRQVQAYVELFKLKLKKADHDLIFATDIEGFNEGVRKAEVAKERKKKADAKKGAKVFPAIMEAWRNFSKTINEDFTLTDRSLADDYRATLPGNTNLRTDGEKVYTSKEIEMPVAVAHRYYKKYLAIVAAGGCKGDCSYKMLEFEVQRMDENGLLVGCHDIPRSEIDYIANKLGWNN